MTDAARNLRISVLEMAYHGGDANLQSVFSSIEIMRVLYDKVLRISPATKESAERDYFILSKGQATMGLLALLAEKGYFEKEELESACQYGSRISMQADRTKLPGIEISAGSLGHGFAIAAGIAYACKTKRLSNRIYVLAGDGEMNEGTMWEAALFAASEEIDNLTLIVDDNESLKDMLNIGDLGSKLEAFGFDTVCVDGHDEEDLFKAFARPHAGRPNAVVARTKRGYGSYILMNDRSWFHRAPDKRELRQLVEDVRNFEIGG